jgi:hypothetical protein
MRPTRVDPATGEKREWNGTTWVPAGEMVADRPGAPRMSMPAPGPSSRTDADDLEVLKQFLTTGGTIGGGLLGGLPGAIAGGAAGRMVGHAPEAGMTAFTGRPNDSSFADDAAIGGMEGLTQELLPKFAGRIIGAGGTGLKMLGRAMFDNPDASYRARALMGLFRSYAARPLGGTAEAVAAMGPMAASEAGKRMETAGANMGTGTLSERVSGGLDALKARLTAKPPLTHADALAGGAERYAGARRAGALQDAGAARGSGVTSLREPVPDFRATSQPVTPATDIYGDPHGLEDLTNLYHESVGAGMEPNAASKIVLGESRPGGSSLPRAGSWNPGEAGQPFGGITLSDPSVDALTQKVKPWPTPSAGRQAELLDRFGGTSGKAPAPTATLKPTARYGFEWPDVGTQYHVEGGPFDRSTVGAGRLRELGIDVPAAPGADPNAIDVGVSNTSLDALAKRLGLMKDKPF